MISDACALLNLERGTERNINLIALKIFLMDRGTLTTSYKNLKFSERIPQFGAAWLRW